jgi:hypothetical protein
MPEVLHMRCTGEGPCAVEGSGEGTDEGGGEGVGEGGGEGTGEGASEGGAVGVCGATGGTTREGMSSRNS